MADILLKGSSLKLVFDNGVDENGKPMFKTKTFNNIRLEATADELLKAAQAIDSLSQKDLFNVERNDSSDVKA
ncbi:DUF1659 domain-containing protein [Heyndrickxia sporothermodurans]|uniref:DUF1659 domain-containing protein n=1 Tax=Heyndrickxia sporothermodurans TaxID=46224 RepID=A0A150LE74_9BACI|nr:DUF1659 domain-containing protein [Heyndrickxia sporothermodurans]KYD10653.1 hypothetical protein B4102_2292 [Heyndrickxia sporothermodurans]MEB6549174.1 DUF1659 domain-containing protein [Heyndrickxia sporothermodurans]MED3650448.1 DUF1659 domain-containing protein [Heyndrickxia sporothermodurans]MED3654902.1 DUF1659 domain-containing protein [Heyndrickxia sporothermodurans]MED3699275.1 DUF1659 domain-containing protein [Heyndrickxia sporothermodurans]